MRYLLLSLRSSSSFLRLLPRLLATSISPFIFPSTTCFRRQFLRKIWPIKLASRFLISCRIFLCSLILLEFFHWHNPSVRTVALGLIQSLTEMSNRNISWGCKGGRCLGLTTLPPSCAECLKFYIWVSVHHKSIIYNKPTRCNSGSTVFIKNYKYALHVSDAFCVHHQEHYKP